MKKIIAFLCLVTIVFSVCSCEYSFWENESTSSPEEKSPVSNIEKNKNLDDAKEDDPTDNVEKDEPTEDAEDQKVLFYSMNALRIYKKGERYLIGFPQGKQVEFSPDRECCSIQGFELIENEENIEKFIGMYLYEVVAQFGNIHVDIGSGLSIPAYITEEAYLISFILGRENVIMGVIKDDLLTREMVNQVRAS